MNHKVNLMEPRNPAPGEQIEVLAGFVRLFGPTWEVSHKLWGSDETGGAELYQTVNSLMSNQ